MTRGKDILVGAKGITYLMFLYRRVNQAVVGKVLCKNNIVKNQQVIRVYVNKLEEEKLLTKGKLLKRSPGPQKTRRVKTLRPIFDTLCFHRVWKISAYKDERQLTKREKEQIKLLFKNVACFLDYFPNYFSGGIKTLGKRSIRNVQWHETLKIFFQFCEKLIEVCWEIKHYKIQLNEDYLKRHRIRRGEENNPLVAFEHMLEGPYRYVYNAYNRKKITDQHISALANFSRKGHKDIYLKGTLLQELHLLSIALTDPFFASAFFHNIEDVEAILWEDKLRAPSIMALDMAISSKAREERMRISKLITKRTEEEMKVKDLAKAIAMHEATDQFRREAYSFKEADVNQALRMVIGIADLDMTEEELRKALIDFRVCQLLERYIDRHRKDFELQLKDGKVLKLGWEKITS